MVPKRSKVGNDQKSAQIERDSIERRTIDRPSTHMTTPIKEIRNL